MMDELDTHYESKVEKYQQVMMENKPLSTPQRGPG
jgi:hypothetical protein